MSPEHYFNDKSAILLHPGTRCSNFASHGIKLCAKDVGCAGNKITVSYLHQCFLAIFTNSFQLQTLNSDPDTFYSLNTSLLKQSSQYGSQNRGKGTPSP